MYIIHIHHSCIDICKLSWICICYQENILFQKWFINGLSSTTINFIWISESFKQNLCSKYWPSSSSPELTSSSSVNHKLAWHRCDNCLVYTTSKTSKFIRTILRIIWIAPNANSNVFTNFGEKHFENGITISLLTLSTQFVA